MYLDFLNESAVTSLIFRNGLINGQGAKKILIKYVAQRHIFHFIK